MVVEHVLSKDGIPVIRINDNGKIIHLGSVYNYENEASRWLKKYSDIRNFATIVIFGLADGGFILRLIQKLPSNVNVIIYEPSTRIYEYAKNVLDLSNIINNDSVHIYVGNDAESSYTECLWQYIDDTNYKISMLDLLPGYSNLFNAEYERIMNLYNVRLEHCISDKMSAAAHGRLEVINSIYNLRYIENCNTIDQLYGLFPTELPAVIVSAGPSLEKNGQILKKLKNRLFLIVVDTAVPYVLSQGIIPDVVVTVSPVKDVSLYQYKQLSEIPIAIDPRVTHKGLEMIDDSKIIYISAPPYYEKILSHAEIKISELESGGNVSSSALSFAVQLGFDKIVLVGLDLALKDEVLYAGNISNDDLMKMQRIPANGYYGDTVYTLPNYKVFLDWFNMTVSSHRELTVYNSTEGGAQIEGCINVPLEEIVKRYEDVLFDYSSVIKSLPKSPDTDMQKKLRIYLNDAASRLAKISKNLDKGFLLLSRSGELLDNGLSYTNKEVIELYKEINKVIDDCSGIDEMVLVERYASESTADILSDINVGENDPELEYRRLLNKLEVYFSDLKNAAVEIAKLFDKANSINGILCPQTAVAKDGSLITEIIVDGERHYLNSTYSPVKEADKFAEQYKNINRYGIMVICGFSNGIIARSIIEAVPDHVRLIFVEPSKEIYAHTMDNFDVSDIVNNPRVCVLVKGINDDRFEGIVGSLLNEASYKYTYYDALPGYKNIFSDDYNNIYTKYENLIQIEKNNIETIKYRGREEAVNNIYNLRLLKQCNCEEEYRGKFPIDLPVVIVAAGPSLKKNISELKRLKNKLMIIAVENVVRYLIENGIRPDISVIVDPIISVDVVDGIRDENIIYAYGTGSSCRLMEHSGDGRKIAITTRCAYYDNIFDIVDHHIYALDNAGSVANVAFSLARDWGYTKFVLVGQDLAYEGDVKYADGKIGYNDEDKKQMYDVPGYNGGLVKTAGDFKVYLEWYELIARTHPELEIINATEGGARIEGTIQKPLTEIADEYSWLDIDYEQILLDQPVLFSGEKYEELKKFIEQSMDNLMLMKNMLGEGITLIDNNISAIDNADKKYSYDINNKRISEIMSKCADMQESYFVDGIIADDHADDLADLYDENADPMTEYRRMLDKTRMYAADMSDACDEVKRMFCEVIGDFE